MKLRRLLIVFLSFLLIAAGLYSGSVAWLESSGGRQAIEKQLSAAAGMPVHLAGAFDLSLLPVPRAEGTELVVTDAAGIDLVRSRAFSVDLALKPLLKRQFLVDRLELEWLTLGAPGGTRMALPSVAISGFEPGSETGLAVDLGWLGAVDGTFTWSPERAEVGLDLSWTAEGREPIDLSAVVAYFPDHARLEDLAASIGGQQLAGRGCLLTDNGPRLNLDLRAGVLDLEALAAAIPGGEGTAGALPLELNLRLSADEMRRGDLRAIDSVVELGDAPLCP